MCVTPLLSTDFSLSLSSFSGIGCSSFWTSFLESSLIEYVCIICPAFDILPKTDLLCASISSSTCTSLSNLRAQIDGDETENLVRFWPSFVIPSLIEYVCAVSSAYAILPKTGRLRASISSLTCTSLSSLRAERYGDEAENLVRFWPFFVVSPWIEPLCTISPAYGILPKADLLRASISLSTCTSLSSLRVGRDDDEVENLVRFWTSFMVLPLIVSICTISPAYEILSKADLLCASISSLTWTSLSNLKAERDGDEAENLVRFWPSFVIPLLIESVRPVSPAYDSLPKTDLPCASISSSTCTSLSNLKVGRNGDEA